MRRLHVGVIGAGNIAASIHVPILQAWGDVDLAALCDVREDRARALAARFQIPAVHVDHRQLLADTGIDAVYVLTPPMVTGPVARDCLETGVATCIEKPRGSRSRRRRRASRHSR